MDRRIIILAAIAIIVAAVAIGVLLVFSGQEEPPEVASGGRPILCFITPCESDQDCREDPICSDHHDLEDIYCNTAQGVCDVL